MLSIELKIPNTYGLSNFVFGSALDRGKIITLESAY